MGRPKLSDLSCTICNVKFKRKNLLNEHMENHLSSKPSRKHLKSYCYICRKSFEPNKFKVHIQTEHQYDFPKVNSNATDDLYSCENGFVFLSKKKNKEENEKLSAIEKGKSLVVSLTDIKIEPTDKVNEESDWEDHKKTEDKTFIKKNVSKFKIPKLKCSICGMRYKGEKGLKIHMSAHKRSRCSSQSESENDDHSLSQSPKGTNANTSFSNPNIQFSMPNTGAANYAQPNYILNVSQFQSQPKAQLVQTVPNPNNLPSDNIPKFDCDSEKYMKWLKKFVSECKMHNYPLNPELCKKISVVTGEITTALGNPKSSLKQKAKHFYFMSFYNMLSEIMLNHLQYTLCGISK